MELYSCMYVLVGPFPTKNARLISNPSVGPCLGGICKSLELQALTGGICSSGHLLWTPSLDTSSGHLLWTPPLTSTVVARSRVQRMLEGQAACGPCPQPTEPIKAGWLSE